MHAYSMQACFTYTRTDGQTMQTHNAVTQPPQLTRRTEIKLNAVVPQIYHPTGALMLLA